MPLPKSGVVVVFVLLSLKVTEAFHHPGPTILTYSKVAEYPHDPDAFTQGLEYDRSCKTDSSSVEKCSDIFWESTGLYGKSSVRQLSIDSGQVLLRTDMDRRQFGEGLTKMGDKIYQITWLSGAGFIYDAKDLKQVGTFLTELKDGWGLTNNGTHLIATDSGHTLYWLDPVSFKTVQKVDVHDSDRVLPWLNELEYIEMDGPGSAEIWANLWQTECIVRVNMTSGRVTHWVIMHGLRDELARRPGSGGLDVLNGIAWDKWGRRLFVTGKKWPAIFQIQVSPQASSGGLTVAQARTKCWPPAPSRPGGGSELKFSLNRRR